MNQTQYFPMWHWEKGLDSLNPVARYRILGHIGFQETIMEDDLRHHQPIYWTAGLGDRKLGRAIIGRIMYISFFPIWIIGETFAKFGVKLGKMIVKGVKYASRS